MLPPCASHAPCRRDRASPAPPARSHRPRHQHHYRWCRPRHLRRRYPGATRAGIDLVAGTAGERIRDNAGARAVADLTGPALGPYCGESHAPAPLQVERQMRCRTAFRSPVATLGVGRALSRKTGLVCRMRTCIARRCRRHTPIHAETRGTGLSRWNRLSPFWSCNCRLPSHACPSGTASGNFGTRGRGCAGAFVTGHVARTGRTRRNKPRLEHKRPPHRSPRRRSTRVAAVHPSPLPRFVTLYSQTSFGFWDPLAPECCRRKAPSHCARYRRPWLRSCAD